MKLAKNRKVLIALSIVLALVIGASATFAWVTSRNQIANEFANEGFANSGLVVIEPQEKFKWKEFGATEDKEVSILNTGSSPMLARVTFEEMIKLLGDNGDITYNAVKADDTPAPAGLIPVAFDMDNLAGWQTLAAVGISTSAVTIPSGVTVYKLNNAALMFKAVYAYTVGTETRYQMVKFDGKLNADKDALTAAAFEYGWYTEGTAKYSSWNDAENYKAAAWLAKKAAATAVGGKPATAADSVVNADDIHMVYNTGDFAAGIAGALSTYQDKWFYNAADGYFYYMGVLASGQATNDLLDAVKLLSGADGSYSDLNYDLTVIMDGIQNTEAAIDELWGVTGALKTELLKYCK